MFLFLLTALALAGQPTKRPSDSDRGGQLYMQNCWMCHGKKGQGNGPAASAFKTESPPLAKMFSAAERDQMIRVIMDGKHEMPAFNSIMDRADARRILMWLEDPKPVKSASSGIKSKVKKPKTKSATKSKSNEAKKPVAPKSAGSKNQKAE